MSDDAGATLVHVVRHGRTALNAEGRFRGLADPPLDDTGFAEVERTASRFSGRSVAAIATSRLLRARQTSDAVARVSGVEPAVDPGLLDVDMGAWQGLTPEEAAARDPDAFETYRRDPRSASTPSGEPLARVEQRVRSAVEALAAAHPGGEVVAVSHEAPIKLLVSGVLGVDGLGVWELDLPTASLTTIRIQGGRWQVVRVV
jgi:broad specificity phosphatase PhoE